MSAIRRSLVFSSIGLALVAVTAATSVGQQLPATFYTVRDVPLPAPLAAQCAIALGYFEQGFLGATLIALAFVLPSFVMVIALSMAYVAFGGLWWMQALFYGIGAAVIAIIAIAAYKLARSTNKRDPLSWGIFAALFVVTILTRAELAVFFVFAGLLALAIKAPPTW